MDLALTAAEAAFCDEVAGWLAANVPDEPLPSMDTAAGFERHREWERRLAADRWSVVSWPEEFGGRDLGLVEWLLFEEEYYRAGAPGRVNTNGISLLGPTVFAFGTRAQQERFLPPMARGDEIWAQAWSEPGAGSDLAAISCRARRDGEWFVLDGQKTWCSRGGFADWYFGLFRTDPDAERHRGLSYLLVPRDTEGLTVREVSRLDGDPAFAELFFEGARVHESNLLGDENDGWGVAMRTASSERGLNLRAPGRFTAAADRLVDLYRREADQAAGADHAVRRDAVVRAWIGAQAYRQYTWQTAGRLVGGATIGAEASLNKIFWSELDVAIHETALALLGDRAEIGEGDPTAVDAGAWLDGYEFALAGPIYAGTNEIQRNVVAERMLGLPRR